MLRKAILGFLILLLAASGLTLQPTGATAAPPLARVTVLPNGTRTDNGRSLTVRVSITCAPYGTNGIQWEGAFYSIRPALDGEWVPLVCDGRPHVEDIVLYGMDPFTEDVVTVYAVIMDENDGLKRYATDTRTVKVR